MTKCHAYVSETSNKNEHGEALCVDGGSSEGGAEAGQLGQSTQRGRRSTRRAPRPEPVSPVRREVGQSRGGRTSPFRSRLSVRRPCDHWKPGQEGPRGSQSCTPREGLVTSQDEVRVLRSKGRGKKWTYSRSMNLCPRPGRLNRCQADTGQAPPWTCSPAHPAAWPHGGPCPPLALESPSLGDSKLGRHHPR